MSRLCTSEITPQRLKSELDRVWQFDSSKEIFLRSVFLLFHSHRIHFPAIKSNWLCSSVMAHCRKKLKKRNFQPKSFSLWTFWLVCSIAITIHIKVETDEPFEANSDGNFHFIISSNVFVTSCSTIVECSLLYDLPFRVISSHTAEFEEEETKSCARPRELFSKSWARKLANSFDFRFKLSSHYSCGKLFAF